VSDPTMAVVTLRSALDGVHAIQKQTECLLQNIAALSEDTNATANIVAVPEPAPAPAPIVLDMSADELPNNLLGELVLQLARLRALLRVVDSGFQDISRDVHRTRYGLIGDGIKAAESGPVNPEKPLPSLLGVGGRAQQVEERVRGVNAAGGAQARYRP
jgi:hypothetical protein